MGEQEKIDVSIITPYWKEPLWMLKRNVESVLTQITDYNVEHIVVIDNPHPRPEILNYLVSVQKTYRLGFIIQPENK